jgi:sulfate/thiosulfate transport system substrate-binding protein
MLIKPMENVLMTNRPWRLAAALMTLLLLPMVAAGCGSDEGEAAGGGGGGKISLVAYSTPQEVYTDHLIPAFQKTTAGKGTEFTTSFAGSGDQRRAIEAGLPTDYVHMNLEPDMSILLEKGLIPEDYRADEFKGSPQQSVVVIATRKGNPLGIKDWDDILDKDIEIINANPFTSGGARWNVMAVYGQVIKGGGTEEEGLEAVRKLLERVPTYPASARDALNEFLGGKGDVALQYENEAIQAQLAGEDIDYIVPDSTIKIDTLAAIATEAQNPEGAKAFYDFLHTDEAQQIWADNGYRPVVESILEKNRDKFPAPPDLFTIEDLGGWDEVMTEFFDPDNGKIAAIQKDLGGPLE